MKVSDILTLAAAGFTAQQIAAISTAFAAEQPAATVQQPATTPAQQPPAAPVQQSATAQQPDQTAEILKQLGIISGQITAANIAGSTQPQQQTVEEILAEVIRPPKKEG